MPDSGERDVVHRDHHTYIIETLMPPTPPTDAELDVYIMTRYALMGIDISVLPIADAEAPMDQTRLLANARSIIRQDVDAATFAIDPQRYIPTAFPPQFMAWTRG